MGAEAGYTPRAVGGAAHGLVEQVFVPQGFQHPPAGFDVVVVQCDVRVVHVDPVADAGGHGLPLFHVAEDALSALLVEFFNAVFLNLPLALQTKFFLDLKLNWQTVGVPTALALHPEPLHGSIAAYYVFEDPGEGVVYSGTAVGRGWALIHHEKRGVWAFGLSAPEDVFFLPLLQDVGVQLGEIDATRYGLKHAERRSF